MIRPYEGERDAEKLDCVFYDECWALAVKANAAKVPCGRKGGKGKRGCLLIVNVPQRKRRKGEADEPSKEADEHSSPSLEQDR